MRDPVVGDEALGEEPAGLGGRAAQRAARRRRPPEGDGDGRHDRGQQPAGHPGRDRLDRRRRGHRQDEGEQQRGRRARQLGADHARRTAPRSRPRPSSPRRAPAGARRRSRARRAGRRRTASQAMPWTRSAREPLTSTRRSSANDPNAAKVATSTSCRTWVPNANSSGITIATRPARRSARRPGSCRRSQVSGLTPRNLVPARRSAPGSARPCLGRPGPSGVSSVLTFRPSVVLPSSPVQETRCPRPPRSPASAASRPVRSAPRTRTAPGAEGPGRRRAPALPAPATWGSGGRSRRRSTSPRGATHVVAEIDGPGKITHVWLTTHRRHWRELVLRATWDAADEPAVEVPVGDFFANGLGDVRPGLVEHGRGQPARRVQQLLADAVPLRGADQPGEPRPGGRHGLLPGRRTRSGRRSRTRSPGPATCTPSTAAATRCPTAPPTSWSTGCRAGGTTSGPTWPGA